MLWNGRRQYWASAIWILWQPNDSWRGKPMEFCELTQNNACYVQRVARVPSRLIKKYTNYCRDLQLGMKFAITLGYWASGSSYKSFCCVLIVCYNSISLFVAGHSWWIWSWSGCTFYHRRWLAAHSPDVWQVERLSLPWCSLWKAQIRLNCIILLTLVMQFTVSHGRYWCQRFNLRAVYNVSKFQDVLEHARLDIPDDDRDMAYFINDDAFHFLVKNDRDRGISV